MIDIKILGATQLANALSDKQQMRVERVKMLLDAVQLLEDAAKQRAPEKSRRLKKSIKGFVYSSGNKAYVRAGARHAHLVEYGTGAHTITAGKARKRGKVRRALKLPDGILRASAQHPGAAKKPFMHPALDENTNEIDRILEKHGGNLTTRIAMVAK